MKRKFIKVLPIIFIVIFGIKVEAFTGTTTISESPTSTEKGNYITLKHTVDTDASEMSIEYYYDTKYLQLVGFVPTNTATCILEGNYIKCSEVAANTTFVYPIFKVVSTFNGNKDISATFNTLEAHNTTKTTIKKVDKKIDVTKIQLDSYSENLIVGKTYQIVTTILPENATDKTVTYTSSNESIATVSETGLVTALKAGTATINLSSGSVNSVFTVTINDEEIPLEKIIVTESMDLKIGDSKALEVTYEPENTTIDTRQLTYSSSDSKIAIVDSNGKVVALGSGTATITVSLGDQTASITVTVAKEEVKEVEVEENSSFGACVITAIVTFIVSLLLFFIISSIKRKKEINNVNDDNDDFKLNSYI